MASKRTGEFEAAIDRLEQIVKELESGDIGLDDSVRLYREGRELARKCEQLLKNAQDEVEAASREVGDGRQEAAGATPPRRSGDDALPF